MIGYNELYKTTDSGSTWTLNSNVTGFGIAEFSTFQDSTIFIVGENTFRSIDGGENWLEFTELNGITLTGLSLLNSGFGYAVGSGGLILRYSDTSFIPVELISFKAQQNNDKIVLSWITASELNNYGFEVQRSFESADWEKIGFVSGNGTTTEEHSYSFTDEIENPDHYYYRLKQIDYNGTFEYSNIIEVNVNLPLQYNLSQNYPNPFNPSTRIIYSIPSVGTQRAVSVQVKVYNLLGREVAVLTNEVKGPGYYEVEFNASNLSSGVYFYQLSSGDYVNTKKMLLLK